MHKPIIHEQHKEIVTEEQRKPVILEKTEKAVVTQEVRPPIVERNVQAPEIKKEGFIEPPQVLKEGEFSAAEPPKEERSGLGGMISGVLSEIKHTLVGDEPKKQ